jgi:hypothetical protein
MRIGKIITEGFGMLSFDDGFSNDQFTGMVNYEQINIIKKEIPLLIYNGDPYVDLLNFIDAIDKPNNKYRANFMSEELNLQVFDDGPDDEENTDPYIPQTPDMPDMPFDIPDDSGEDYPEDPEIFDE